jgi:hypothetical protein
VAIRLAEVARPEALCPSLLLGEQEASTAPHLHPIFAIDVLQPFQKVWVKKQPANRSSFFTSRK